MKEKDKIGRREFLAKTALAAVAVPAILQGGLKTGHAAGEPSGSLIKESTKKIKKICIEEHWANQSMVKWRTEWVARTGFPLTMDPKNSPNVWPRLPDFEKWRLPLMDEVGVTMQVLSTGSPGIQGFPDAASAISEAKRINDEQAEIIRKYPGRFAGFAALPTHDPKAAADELERSVKQLNFKGAMIHGHTLGEYLDLPKYWAIWERAEALGAPIYLHPTEPIKDQIKIYEGRPEFLGPAWNWGVETGTHALRIICGGVFDAFPKATLILGHMGEMLPYMTTRIDEGYVMTFKKTKLKKWPSDYIKENIVITTSGKYSPAAMLCAIKEMGADRIIFAGDYSWVSPKEAVEHLERTGISDADKEKIYHLNAERWLKLK
jgi:2,3-dihydroxybenzoate decarboxylase